jgi:hypothetical protein
MNAGQYISGAGHIGLIGWLLFGGTFASEPLPFQVTDVAVITGEQFDAMMAAQRPPETVTEVAMPAPPKPDTPPEPQPEATRDQPVDSAQPEVAATPPPDKVPDLSQITPPTPAEVQDTPPEITPPSEEVAVVVPEQASRPQARPIERVAPTPVAQPPEPEVKIDEAVRQETAPTPEAEVVKPEEQETAPKEAVKEIVPEAKDPVSAAPAQSKRPKSRPAAPPKPETRTETANAETGAAKQRDAVKDALAEALAGAATPAPEASGPPLTQGETDALRVAVSKCWNLGALSSDAMAVTITVAVAMSEDARPITGSIRLIKSTGGSQAAANQAFEAARRAIIRCGATGYNLPIEKIGQWRDIEMTFNPEKMR